MRLSRGCRVAWLLVVVTAAVAASARGGAADTGRDDTAWLQGRLDAGGRVFLPKLDGGACYHTRGLWVSRDGTRITSDGACIDYLGPGPARLVSADGDPIEADAVLVVNRGSIAEAAPEHISISDVTLNVPIGTVGYGAIVAGHDVTLTHVNIVGVPIDGVTITGRGNGSGYAGPVTVQDGFVHGARRNGISVVGADGVTISGNTITGAGLIGMTNPDRGPWAGIDVEPNVAAYPIRRVTISGNTIYANGGPGVLLALVAGDGQPEVADQITLAGNAIKWNSGMTGSFLRGGVCLQGGQSDGSGSLTLTENDISGNGGWGLCSDATGFSMRIALICNRIYGNADGESQWGVASSLSPVTTNGATRAVVGCD